MQKTYRENINMWALDTDADHILHRIGSKDYSEIRHTIVKDPEEWEEIAVADIPPYTEAEYKAKVEELIRERYSASDEFAIQRKMLNAMLPQLAILSDEDAGQFNAEKAIAEYTEYNAYAEQCKADAPDAIAEDKARREAEQRSIQTDNSIA